MKSTKAQQTEFKVFLDRLRSCRLWVRVPGTPGMVVFSPDALEDQIVDGKYMYDPKDFDLVDPVDLLCELENKKEEIFQMMRDEVSMQADDRQALVRRVHNRMHDLSAAFPHWRNINVRTLEDAIYAEIEHRPRYTAYPAEILRMVINREIRIFSGV